LLVEARAEALAWLQKNPELKSKESSGTREILKHKGEKGCSWGRWDSDASDYRIWIC
jgi:hypothetical protein